MGKYLTGCTEADSGKTCEEERGGKLKGEEAGKSGIRGKIDGTGKSGIKPACESAGRRQRRKVGSDHIEGGFYHAYRK